MFCKNCGQQLNDNAAFCPKCGTKVGVNSNKKEVSGSVKMNITTPAKTVQKSGKKHDWIIFLVVCLLMLGIGWGVVMLLNHSGDKKQNILSDEIEQAQKTSELTKEDVENEQSSTENISNNIILATDIVEDYGANLDINDYRYYDSEISDFCFYYPINLYNDVVFDNQEMENSFGTNVRTVHFTGSGGSELIFSLSRYKDVSVEEMSEQIYSIENGELCDASVIIRSADEDYGKIVITGYTVDGLRLIYDLLKVDAEYVMQMRMICPVYKNSKDKIQKGYVTECLHRLCGFSDSSDACRSYAEYEQDAENAVHRYELIVEDVTWQEAFDICIGRGGYLVRINSEEEYRAIQQQISNEDKSNIMFWLGGRRDSVDTWEYRWVYEDGTYGREALNEDNKYSAYWWEGEPNYSGETVDGMEMYMDMFYMSDLERWVWNDVPNDIVAIAEFYSGRIGYICEYED